MKQSLFSVIPSGSIRHDNSGTDRIKRIRLIPEDTLDVAFQKREIKDRTKSNSKTNGPPSGEQVTGPNPQASNIRTSRLLTAEAYRRDATVVHVLAHPIELVTKQSIYLSHFYRWDTCGKRSNCTLHNACARPTFQSYIY